MSLFREFSLIALLTIVGGCYSLISGLSPQPWAQPVLAPGEIAIDDAKSLEAIWIDARNMEAYEIDHAPNAICLNEANWDDGLARLMERWLTTPRPIIIYCSDAGCGTSKRIAEQLRRDLPDAEIYTLKGGWAVWSR